MKSLNKRLIIIFMMFSLGIILLVGISSKIFIRNSFNKYIEESIITRKNEVINDITNSYNEGNWNEEVISNIGMNALENGLVIKVKNSFNKEIWNARSHNNGMCESILANISENTYKFYKNSIENYIIENIDININNIKVGSVEIEYYGPFYYRDSDVIYINTLNYILIIIGVLATIVSFIIGLLISKSISKPINSVIKTTNLIAEGHYKNRINEKNNINEINELMNSINIMASSLEKQENMRKVLTKDISHELKTPITSIMGQLEAISDGIWEPTQERIDSIYEEMERLNRLVGSLENLMKIENSMVVLNKENIYIHELIGSILLNFEKALLDKKINIELSLNNCIYYGNKDKLSQVIVNLISNAIKYSNINGTISLKCFYEKNSLVIIVKDNGIGIGSNHIPYIFERLYRVDESRTRKTGGAGIGLSVTKAIVEAHGGKIYVKSKEGKGSEFIIKLPK